MVEDKKPNSFFSGKTIASVAAILFAAGGFAAWYTHSNLQRQNQVDNSTNQQQNNKTSVNEDKQQVPIYLLDDQSNIVSHTVEVNKSEKSEDILASSFDYLFNDAKENTAIPEKTKLIALDVKDDGIYVNLSSEFTDGGGSTSMIGRLGQIVYTATAVDNNAAVWISVEGEPLQALGGEGIMVEQPMTRELFLKYFSN